METPAIVAHAVPPRVAAAVPPPLPHPEDGPAAGDDPAADAALAAAIERLARHGGGAGGPRIHATTLDLFDLFAAGERPAASQPPAPFLPRRRREVSSRERGGGGPHAAWQATVRLANEAPFYVGTFATAEAAALAYNDAVAYHGLARALRTNEGKWVASVRRLIRHGGDGGTEHLGTFDDEDAAGRAVDAFTFAHLPSFYAAAANFRGDAGPAPARGRAGRAGAAARDATGAYLIWARAPAPPHRARMASRYQRQKAARESERRKAEAAHEALLASFSSSFAGDSAEAPPEEPHIDAFLEELKGRQASGAPLAEAADAPGSFTDDGDRSTTNLYVGNISPASARTGSGATEAYGPVASVKIMWPRSDDERRRGRNCGFVSFRERRDAADALEISTASPASLGGLRLSVGWGKALAARPDDRPARAPAARPDDRPARAPAPRPTTGRRGPRRRARTTGAQRPDDRAAARRPAAAARRPGGAARRAAGAARRPAAAAAGRARAAGAPAAGAPAAARASRGPGRRRAAMRDDDARVEVSAPVDEERRAVIELLASFVADDGFELEAAVREPEAATRSSLGEAMAFCYDHVAAAEAVSAILKGALVAAEPTLALGKRVARLYLASDVLRNSSLPMKGAQAYRAALQACLPEALLRLNAARLATTSRMASAAFEDRVASTLAAWHRWSVFPPAFIHGLEATFFASGPAENGCFDHAGPPPDGEALRRRARQLGVHDGGDWRDVSRA
ncbi:hypothetical protein SO694_00123089 [Aureococcus anophagefferens]|uniref:RRM domain-containing protein n=1 Tax=Aureococcus anophagefferens TaxID=44056 RepID=A0ABR1FIW4_AURAN